MIAEVDWAVLIPSTIAAIAAPIVTIVTLKMSRTIQQNSTKLEAIDTAVNKQPEGSKPLVEKVGDILNEQQRVAAELESMKNGESENAH